MMASSRRSTTTSTWPSTPSRTRPSCRGPDDPLPRPLDEKVPGVGKRWDGGVEAEIRARNEAERTADYEGLSNAELVAKFDEHDGLDDAHSGGSTGTSTSCSCRAAKFCDLYDEVMQPDESDRGVPDPPGLPHPLGRCQPGPVASSAARSRPARRCRRRSARCRPTSCSPRSTQTDEGRALRADLDEFLFEFGWRTTPSTTSPTCRGGRTRRSRWPASPASSTSTTTIRDPVPKSVATRERLLSNMRERLADDPETLAKFDDLYEAAQYASR